MLDNVNKVNGVPANELEEKRGADAGIRGGTRWGRIQIGQQRGGRIIAGTRTSGDDEKKERFPQGKRGRQTPERPRRIEQ